MPHYKTVVPLVALLVVLSSSPVTAQVSPVTPSAAVTAKPVSSWKQVKENEKTALENTNNDRQYQKTKDSSRESQKKVQKLINIDRVQPSALQKKAQRQNILSQAQQTIIRRLYAVMENRLTSRYQFLLSSKAKIQARINEKSSSGLNLAVAQAKLDSAKTYESAYITDLAALKTKLDEILTSADPVKGVSNLAKLARTVTKDLNNLKQVEVAAMKLVIQSGKLPAGRSTVPEATLAPAAVASPTLPVGPTATATPAPAQ